jgi:hypothetical protein
MVRSGSAVHVNLEGLAIVCLLATEIEREGTIGVGLAFRN